MSQLLQDLDAIEGRLLDASSRAANLPLRVRTTLAASALERNVAAALRNVRTLQDRFCGDTDTTGL